MCSICTCCAKSIIKTLGIIILVIFGLASIAGVILTGFKYSEISIPTFQSLIWDPLSTIQIVLVAYCLTIACFGVVVFCCSYTCCTILFAIMIIIGIITIGGIGILSILTVQYNWVSSYLSCNTKWKDLLLAYQGMDTYVHHIDQNFCSKECPCYMNDKSRLNYASNSTLVTYYNQWNKTTNISDAHSFQNCSKSVKSLTYSQTTAENTNFSNNKNFNDVSFFSYMANLEKNYKCMGFCNVTYYNTNTNSNVLISKYLFTDINNGPGDNFGCFGVFLKDLPNYLHVFGSIAIAVCGFQILILIFTFCLCCLDAV